MFIKPQGEMVFIIYNQIITQNYDAKPHPLPDIPTESTVASHEKSKIKHNRWSKTGTVVEILPNHQYQVKVDGSGRVTLRNPISRRPMMSIHNHYLLISPMCNETPQAENHPPGNYPINDSKLAN